MLWPRKRLENIKMKNPVFNILIVWLTVISIVSLFIVVYDKKHARKNKRRIAENTLWILAASGGAGIMYIAMLLVRHKTLHKSFMVLLPMITIVQMLLIILLYKLQI